MSGNQDYIKEAVKALGITVPVMRTEYDDDGNLVLFLYGGSIARYGPGGTMAPPKERNGDDFTTIPGVGAATARKLQDAGVFTFAMLRQAWDVWLRSALTGKITDNVFDAIEQYNNTLRR